MIGTEYQSSTGVNMMLALTAQRKKVQLYISEGKSWRRVAAFDNAECVELFLKMFGMSRPEWLGQTYEQALAERFPFTVKQKEVI